MNPEEETPEAKARARARAGFMNIEAQEVFDRLVTLNPQDLLPEEREFLFARRSYLNDRQTENFAEVLKEQEALAEQKLRDEAPEVKVEQETKKTK